MVSEWKIVKFKELYLIPSRNGLSKPKRVRGEGVKFINMGEIFKFDRMLNIPTDRVPVNDKELNSSLLKNNDLLFARQSLVLSGAGKCSIFLGDVEPVVFESHLIRVRPDESKVYSEYLYYFFQSPQGRSEIWGITEQGAGQAGIRGSDLETVNIPIPSFSEQKAIAHILGALDDKVELNRQMNETLESMAQALFKSWFVDFDPVIDNALLAGKVIPEPLKERAEMRQAQLDSGKAKTNSEINDLFPSEFEFTEALGWIPKGWSVGKFSDLAKLNPESWSKKNIPDEILYVDLGNTNNGKIDSVTPYLSSDAPSRAKRVLAVDDTIIGTVRPGNRSFAYIHNDGLTGSTGFAVMRPLELKNRSYIYFGLTQDKVIDYFSNMASGSAYPAINSSVVADLECVIPPANLLEIFDTKAYAFINKIGMNNNYNETLAKLRDTLLPKLMSGELRIADAETLVAEGI